MINLLKRLFKKRTYCPYCGYDLQEMPKSKKYCPECRQLVYKKKSPKDQRLHLVTEEQAQAIEKEWDRHYQDKREKELKEQLSKTEVHLKNGDFGLYRNSRKAQAELFELKEESVKALAIYSEVLFLDANGCTNHGSFDLRRASLPVGIVNTTKQLIEELEIDQFSVHKTFVAVNTPVSFELDAPLDPQTAWHETIKKSLFDN